MKSRFRNKANGITSYSEDESSSLWHVEVLPLLLPCLGAEKRATHTVFFHYTLQDPKTRDQVEVVKVCTIFTAKLCSRSNLKGAKGPAVIATDRFVSRWKA